MYLILIFGLVVVIGDLAYILHWLICRKKYPCYSESCPLRKLISSRIMKLGS